MKLIENYKKALEAVYQHVGFHEDWVVAPLDDETDKFWNEDGEIVRYADSVEELERETGNYYEDEIYKQRFYSKWVYEGKDFTMIFCNPGVDGMQWFRLFDNSKRR
jgi:hypothetical protein